MSVVVVVVTVVSATVVVVVIGWKRRVTLSTPSASCAPCMLCCVDVVAVIVVCCAVLDGKTKWLNDTLPVVRIRTRIVVVVSVCHRIVVNIRNRAANCHCVTSRKSLSSSVVGVCSACVLSTVVVVSCRFRCRNRCRCVGSSTH